MDGPLYRKEEEKQSLPKSVGWPEISSSFCCRTKSNILFILAACITLTTTLRYVETSTISVLC